MKKTRHRSPNYPTISLRRALELVEILYNDCKRNQVAVGLAQTKWSYKPLGGVGNQIVAALKAYEFIDIEGSGKGRKIKISDHAYKILENHVDREKLLKESALKPTIYQELWSKYEREGLPDDDTIRHYLQFERHFNPDPIKGIIADFRDTISLANITSRDIITTNEAENFSDDMTVGGKTRAVGQENKPALSHIIPPKGLNMGTDTFTLDEGIITFQYPTSLSKEGFEDLDAWIKLQLRKIERQTKAKSPPPDSESEA